MFAKCPKIDDRRCAFATKRRDGVYCGIITGPKESAKVSHLPECTKNMTKSQIKKHVKGFTSSFS